MSIPDVHTLIGLAFAGGIFIGLLVAWSAGREKC